MNLECEKELNIAKKAAKEAGKYLINNKNNLNKE